MKKNTKKIIKYWIILSMSACSSMIITNIVAQNFYFFNKSINNIDLQNYESNIESMNDIDQQILDANFMLDENNGIIPYRGTSEINMISGATNPNMLCSGRNGYIVGYPSGRGIDLISFSGEKIWGWSSTWKAFQIKQSIYLPSCDKYVVLYCSSYYGFRIMVLDPDTGAENKSDWFGDYGNQWSSAYMVPVINEDGTISDKIIVYSRDWNGTSLQPFFEFTIQQDRKTTWKKITPIGNDTTGDSFTVALGSLQISQSTYIASLNLYENDKNLWLSLYKDGNWIANINTNIIIDYVNKSDLSTIINNLLSSIDIFYENNNIYINWFNNIDSANTLVSYKILCDSNTPSTNFENKSISLNISNVNDFEAYNVTLCNGVICARGEINSNDTENIESILKINLRSSSSNIWNQNNFNINQNKKFENLYNVITINTDKKLFKSNNLIPLINFSIDNQFDQNIAIFCSDSSSLMSKSFQVYDNNGNFPYLTKLKIQERNKIILPNVGNISLVIGKNYSSDLTNIYVTNDIINNNFTQFQKNSSYRIEAQPLSSQDAANGEIPCSVIFEKGYNSESSHAIEISIDVIFTGFNTRSTRIVIPDNPITSLSTYLAQDVINLEQLRPLLLQYIMTNCFVNLPPNFNVNNILDIQFSGYNNELGTISISSIKVNNYINSDGIECNDNHVFEISFDISGFLKSEPTKIKSDYINTNIYIKNINQIIANPDTKKDLEAQLLNWIRKNFTKVFVGLPQSFSSSNVISVELDSSTLDILNNAAQFYVTLDNVFLSNSSCEHVEGQDNLYGPTYFKFLLDNSSNNNQANDSLPYWVWIIIGVSILVIIIILIIFIFKKKNGDNKKRKATINNTIKKPNTNSNKLVASNVNINSKLIQNNKSANSVQPSINRDKNYQQSIRPSLNNNIPPIRRPTNTNQKNGFPSKSITSQKPIPSSISSPFNGKR